MPFLTFVLPYEKRISPLFCLVLLPPTSPHGHAQKASCSHPVPLFLPNCPQLCASFSSFRQKKQTLKRGFACWDSPHWAPILESSEPHRLFFFASLTQGAGRGGPPLGKLGRRKCHPCQKQNQTACARLLLSATCLHVRPWPRSLLFAPHTQWTKDDVSRLIRIDGCC
ncbi:hypothetical protein BC940DRAFT_97134 [Gongronella butleri]|nr:hypothetical protein BC940DRAFT_97134 [Gongronella butleri]